MAIKRHIPSKFVLADGVLDFVLTQKRLPLRSYLWKTVKTVELK
jgi:hypothetical protein